MLLSLASTLWSLGIPLATGPDEPAHFIKAAAVARGEFTGTAGANGTVVQVPEYVAFTPLQLCTAFKSERTADCAPQPTGDLSAIVDGTTTAGSYNPVYYLLVGWPTLILNDASGLYAMRIISGILASGLLALGFMMLGTWRRRTIPLLGAVVAVTPMVFYVNSLVNPSSLEIAGLFAAFAAMLSIVSSPSDRLLRERAVILVLSSALVCNTRGISPLWVALLLLIPLLLLDRVTLLELVRRRVVWLSALLVAASAVLALAWTLFTNSLQIGATAASEPISYDNVGASPAFGFVKMLMSIIDQGYQMIGVLGWFDTDLPMFVYFFWAAFFGTLGIVAAVVLRGRRAITAIALVLALLLGPAFVQAGYITQGGFIWQGRYSLPLLMCAVVGIAVVVSESLPALSAATLRRLVMVVASLWGIAHVASLYQAMRRYAVGAAGSNAAFFRDPAWNPPLGTTVTIVLYLLVIAAAAGAIVMLVRRDTARESTGAGVGSTGRGAVDVG